MNILFGPFLGDFEFEILHFYPWVRWITENLIGLKSTISVYRNRAFLYNWIDEKVFIDDTLARNELHQIRYIHTDINQKQFNKLCREFKNHIASKYNCRIKDLKYFNLSYIKSQFQVSIYNKTFCKPNLNISIKNEHKNRVVFIPVKKNTESVICSVYRKLQDLKLSPLVIGDMKCYLDEYNVILRYSDYFQNVYEYIIQYINNAEIVITPNSHWAYIANLFNKKVFTWGNTASLYKENGIYNFNNEKCTSIWMEKHSPVNTLLDALEYFVRR